VNTKASEQSARMVSMKNATENAETLIKDLTLEYNKLRTGSYHEGIARDRRRPGWLSRNYLFLGKQGG
jgi:hypothetical protein